MQARICRAYALPKMIGNTIGNTIDPEREKK